jgi:hypothetical protein
MPSYMLEMIFLLIPKSTNLSLNVVLIQKTEFSVLIRVDLLIIGTSQIQIQFVFISFV